MCENSQKNIFTEYFNKQRYICSLCDSTPNTVQLSFDSQHLNDNVENVIEFLSCFSGSLIRCASDSDCYKLSRTEICSDEITLTEFGCQEKTIIPFCGSVRDYFLKIVSQCNRFAYTFWLEFSEEEKTAIHETLKHLCTSFSIKSFETVGLTTNYVPIFTQNLATGRVIISMIKDKVLIGEIDFMAENGSAKNICINGERYWSNSAISYEITSSGEKYSILFNFENSMIKVATNANNPQVIVTFRTTKCIEF